MNYNQYLEDYWPEEEPNNNTIEQYQIYYGQVTCIDQQIAELEARKHAMLHGYCFTGVHIPNETIMKEDKKLWKIKYVEEEFYGNEYNHAFVDKEKDIRKLTRIEAEEWLYQVQKERNVSCPKLLYKEDGEWILYKKQ